MAGTYYTGSDAEIWINGAKLAKCTGIEPAESVATLGTVAIGDSYDSAIPGIRSKSGNLSAIYRPDDPATVDLAGIIQRNGGVASIRIYRNRLLNDGYEMDVLITNLSMPISAGGLQTISASWQQVGVPRGI